MPHIHAHSIVKHGKNLIPHAGIQNTSRSFHKQVDKLPHKSRYQLWPPTKMSVRKHLRMHCSRKALWKAIKRPMSINLRINYCQNKSKFVSLKSPKIRIYCYKVGSIRIHNKNISIKSFNFNNIHDNNI